ncbi:MAG TPA: MCE family protein [Aeromicrobium sp.]|nr:MCE family protein [Aeromicrobium sp.]
MKPFRERNPVIIGFIGLAIIACLMVASFRADRLPIIGSGDTYHAQFEEIGGLKDTSEVRIAGVSVGKVRKIELQDNGVLVTFKLDKGTELGSQTTADIRVRTLLGAEFLALDPQGDGRMKKGDTIPLSRTDSPYDVVEAFSELSRTTSQIDTDQLAAALQTVADIAAETPEEFKGAIEGVSKLSQTLASRDGEINDLLVNLKKVTSTINARDDELVALFKDSDVLFKAITQRRDAIHDLLVATQSISTELRGLTTDVRADLKPALTQLDVVTDMLVDNREDLDEALNRFPSFVRVFASALGTGPWFDTYLGGIPPNLDGGQLKIPELLGSGG